jgi:hypothetical protein
MPVDALPDLELTLFETAAAILERCTALPRC